jgi:hypothetical protein
VSNENTLANCHAGADGSDARGAVPQPQEEQMAGVFGQNAMTRIKLGHHNCNVVAKPAVKPISLKPNGKIEAPATNNTPSSGRQGGRL